MSATIALRLHDGTLWEVEYVTAIDARDAVETRDWLVATGPLYREVKAASLVRCSAVVAVVIVRA